MMNREVLRVSMRATFAWIRVRITVYRSLFRRDGPVAALLKPCLGAKGFHRISSFLQR